MLIKLQRGLEKLYRLAPNAAVNDFIVDQDQRDAAQVARSPKEQLLLQEDEDGLAIGLFFDRQLLQQVAGKPTAHLLKDRNFGDFMMLVEGVSHFVYVAFAAQRNQCLSALELELQAEVDKYVTCVLSTEYTTSDSQQLRHRLYTQIEYDSDLDETEAKRYRIANDQAHRYSSSLERRYLATDRIPDMLAELREFYRLDLARKLQFIRAA